MGSSKWCFTINFIILLGLVSSALEPADIVIVVLSQTDGYHQAHANLLKDTPPNFFLTHEHNIHGSWTILPLILPLFDKYNQAKWFLFCLDNTAIRLNKLIKVLSRFQSKQKFFIGHALYDQEPTVIHHFADQTKQLKYPNTVSGFVINGFPENDFSIDASYELSKFIYNSGEGIRLINVPEFCVVSEKNCATFPKVFHSCSSSISRENIFIAIKTYDKNHSTRVPKIIKTWTKYAKNFGFFTNKADVMLPHSIVVPDTSEGHCDKTYAILEYAQKIMSKNKIYWLVITDDDTLISVARLTRLLTCYNPKNLVALGERYGFRVVSSDGFEYLTGGAGVVLSAPLVDRIITSGACECPSSTTPDDMFLFGKCFARIKVKPIHSELFHQARPSDYALAYLASQEPVSFHKFWMIDPIKMYEEWFAEADSVLEDIPFLRSDL
ncbi:hypothetical protein HCN44_008592 [Aphidius gifuensis]|uniref:N-acetylgalactosaminide beta-1,3-galactosyltransferase n=1 Tax=Aphidius gifuensis TaxID=684658 RepID=A0A834XNZ2_APHGI|nr:hypothetical protein HCN44_008592 [Aphidius gifuensis]